MAKFLDYDGLTYLWGKMKLSFQEKLVSGTTIKTINNMSLLGQGDIDVLSDASDVPEDDVVTKFDSEAQLNSTDMSNQELYDFIQSLDVVPKEPFYVEINDPTDSASIVFTKAYAPVDEIDYMQIDPTKHIQGWLDPVIQYSYDGETWSAYTLESALYIGSNSPGDKIYFKSDLFSVPTYFIEDNITYVMFVKAVLYGDDVKLGGNLNSLNQTAAEMPQYAYAHLFSECTSILTMPELPDYIVSNWGYAYMFRGCEGLTDSVELRATTIGEGGYMGIFQDCINLETCTSKLPAKLVEKDAYRYMFQRCTNLLNPPMIYASVVGEYACAEMFSVCSLLSSAPVLTARTLAEGCYYRMFEDCTELVTAPALPANTLFKNCYSYMFSSCGSLENPPQLYATELAEGCYSYMFHDCYTLENAPALPALIMAKHCYEGMFKYSGITTAPALPSTDLAEGCYAYMFEGCVLPNPPALPAMQLAKECYLGMFSYCALDKLTQLPATTIRKDSYKEMFNGIPASSTSSAQHGWLLRVPKTGYVVDVDGYDHENMFTNFTLHIVTGGFANIYTAKRVVDQ